MRQELKDFDWHVYGLSLEDLDYTIRLINEIIADRQVRLRQSIDELKLYDEKGNVIDNSKGGADEAISDMAHYNYIDNLFLWHFGLWRLQGIFEGILKQEFFPDKRLSGLRKKMEFVRNSGFTIQEDDFQELLEWGKLRNALSHFPPEKYRPLSLNKNDLIEYCNLVKKVIQSLKKEKKTLPNKA